MAIKGKSSSQKFVLKIPTDGGELKVEADKLADALTKLLDGLGDFVVTLGKIEKEYPNLIEGLRKVSGNPSLLQRFTESLRPDVLQLFLIILFRLMRISPDLDKLTDLPAEKKVALGTEIKNISESLRKLEEKLRDN